MQHGPVTPGSALDVHRVRADFPILSRTLHNRPLVYFDNAATTQKPQSVLDAITHYYKTTNANVHRGVHDLSVEATAAYENARVRVQRFLGAAAPQEIIFVRGTTEAINLVAHSFVRPRLQPGDEIIVSHMEHHSNIVPWQIVCEQTGAVLRVIPINDRGELLLDEFDKLLGPRTRFVGIVHVSNALGTINPVRDIIERAHARGVPVLVDGAQAAPHLKIDVQALGCDFYAISGHKMYGPTGIGALYGRRDLLDAMPPYQGGGEMIKSVSFERTIYNDVPHRFEAGTPNIAGAIGLGAAVDYLESLGLDAIADHEADLLEHGTRALQAIPGVTLIGTAAHKAAVLSFTVEGVHPHDLGSALCSQGVAIRTGHHCAEPVMRRFGIDGTARASLGLYNTREEIDVMVEVVRACVAPTAPSASAPFASAPAGGFVGMPELDDLHREVIADHGTRPRNRRPLPDADHSAEGYNPLCGDHVTVYVKVRDGLVQDVSFVGSGCAISTASASLMTESIKGKSLEEAKSLFRGIHAMLTGERRDSVESPELGKLEVFSGVCRFPARVKCATLAWHTVNAALEGTQDVVTTE